LRDRVEVVVSATTDRNLQHASIDLRPFGFTRTESRAYAALLRLGPATGYAVAQATRLARANAYGALEGLVRRGAATRLSGPPVRYRAAQPHALLAQLAAEQGEALDRLAHALHRAGTSDDPDTRSLAGERAIANLIMQLVARAERHVEGILGAELVRPTLPAWRHAAERAQLALRVAGTPPPEAATLVQATVAPGAPTTLVIDGSHVVAALAGEQGLTGVWSSHPAIVALATAALRSVL
jgi:sugar-specific transcriptional regulator TrmB